MKKELKRKLSKLFKNGKMQSLESKEKFKGEKSIWILHQTFKLEDSKEQLNLSSVRTFKLMILKKIHLISLMGLL